MSKAAFQSIVGRGEGVGRGCTRGGHGDLLHLCHDHEDDDDHDHDHEDDDDFNRIIIKIMKFCVTLMP